MTLEDRIAPVAAELATVQDKIKELTERADALKAILRDLTDGAPDSYAAGNLTVTISPNRRFDPAAFAAAYPVTQHPEFYKLTPDTTTVKAKVAPEVYESFMRQVGDVKVGLS